MYAPAEQDVIAPAAPNPEGMQVLKRRWIAVSREQRQHDRRAALYRATQYLRVRGNIACCNRDRRSVAPNFFRTRNSKVWVCHQRRPSLRMAEQGMQAIAEHIRRGEIAGQQAQQHERRDFGIGECRFRLAFGVYDRRQQVFAGPRPPLRNGISEIRIQARKRSQLSPVLAWRAQRIEHGDQVARPLPQLRHDGARKAQHVADHLDGDRRSILGDEIEVRLLRRLRKPARRNRFDLCANACETRLRTRWCGAQPR